MFIPPLCRPIRLLRLVVAFSCLSDMATKLLCNSATTECVPELQLSPEERTVAAAVEAVAEFPKKPATIPVKAHFLSHDGVIEQRQQ